MHSVTIYQLPIEHPNAYRDYEFVIRRGKINLEDYNQVWEGHLATNNLEAIFRMLNSGHRPDGYKGTSLSVSNIVRLDGSYYYVNDIGFVLLLTDNLGGNI